MKIPQDTLYAIDKIVRLKLKEEELAFPMKSSHHSTSEIKEITEQTESEEDLPRLASPNNEDNFVTPPTRISAIPRFWAKSADARSYSSKKLQEQNAMGFDEWYFRKETEKKLKQKLINKVKMDL